MRYRWTLALAGAALTVGLAPCALAAQSQVTGVVTGPNLVLGNADGICASGGPCNTYTLNSGEEIQVNLAADNGSWSQLPASTDSSVVALQSESSDSTGNVTALFKVVGPGTADLTAASTGCTAQPASSPCPNWEVEIVGKLAAAMAMTASPTHTVYGQPVTLVADYAFSPGQNPVPTGNVTFYDGNTPIGQAPLQNMDPNGDQASMTISTLSGGTHELSAVFGGDQNFSGSNTVPVLVTVDPAPTQVTATPAVAHLGAPNLYAFSLSATLTRTDTGVPLGGQRINFSAGPTVICSAVTDGQGTATCNGLTSAPAILSNQGYSASFAGTSDYKPSSTGAALVS